jgi:exodeoxyribonuclease VII large subunit
MTATSTVLTVSQLTSAIKNQLETHFVQVKLQGEIANLKPHSSGHLYFDIKDAQAKIPAVFFKQDTRGLGRPPKEGDHILVKGSLTVYPPHGRYQFLVKELLYQGVGELLLKLEALKQKLAERGWFSNERKKPLPRFPKRIGVVTSPTGAVIRDIIHVLSRRFGGVHVILNPVRVQGTEAAREIAQAIEEFNRFQLADVLIVCRGGGSLEDLWPFNEESVAEAIFKSQIPVISAVGHETDFTIADFVADVRAPTPSAAAEIVISEKAHHLQFLEKSRIQAKRALSHLLCRYRERLTAVMRHPLLLSPYSLLGQPLQKLDDLIEKMDKEMKRYLLYQRMRLQAFQKESKALMPTSQICSIRQKIIHYTHRMDHIQKNYLLLKKTYLKQSVEKLSVLNPKNVLNRGYSILFAQKEGSVIVSAQEMTPGKAIRALLSDGEAMLTVSFPSKQEMK